MLYNVNLYMEFQENKEENRDIIEIKMDDGSTKKGKVVFAFNEAGDDFVVYELDNQTFASIIDKDNNLRVLDDKENEIVEEIYNNYLDSLESEDEN